MGLILVSVRFTRALKRNQMGAVEFLGIFGTDFFLSFSYPNLQVGVMTKMIAFGGSGFG